MIAPLNYLTVLNDKNIIKIYKKIDKKNKYAVSHGSVHMNHVVCFAKQIISILNLNEKASDNLLIACVLHDIGRLKDKHSPHEIVGAKMAEKYLKGKMCENDISVICQAILYHSGDSSNSSLSDISFCLKLADKLDYIKSRLLPEFDNLNKFEIYRNTNSVTLKVENKKLIFIYEGTPLLPNLLKDTKYQTLFHGLMVPFAKRFKFTTAEIKVLVN